MESNGNRDFSAEEAGGKWGYVGEDGAWVIEPHFKGAYDFLDGRAWVADDSGKWGCIDLSGEWMIEPRFDDVWCWNHDEGITHVRVGDKYGCIDTSGRWVILPTFDDLTWFHKGMACALVGRKWGIIDVAGSWILKPEWDDIETLDANRLRAREGGLDSVWRYFDRTGKEIDGAT